jgi:DnaJ-domain-containing protein 1
VNEKWKESEARLQSAVSSGAFSQAEMDALKARAQQAEAALEARSAEFEQQTLSSQKRIAKMEDELVQLKSQTAKSEAEVRAALAMASATVILPLSSPMPGDVFSALEECLQLLVQTVATRPWLRLDIESRLGRRRLYICQGFLVGVDSNCPGDLLLRQARRDGLVSSKQYQSLRLLEERSPSEQLEILLRKGFIREVEAEGLLQRYAERVLFEAMSQEGAAFALLEEKPGANVAVLKNAQPLWPVLKEGMERRNTEANFLEHFGGVDAIPVLKTNLTGLVAMGMSKTEVRFFESMDAETRLEALVEDLGFQPKQVAPMLLTAWKLGVIAFSKKRWMHVGASEISTERLFARFEEIRDADYFDVLGVSQEASTSELKDAYMRLMEEFNPLKFAGHKDSKVFSCAEQLTALVEEAFLVLENENQRREYARHLMGNK